MKRGDKMIKIPPGMEAMLSSLSTVLSVVMKDVYKEYPDLQYKYSGEMYHYTSADIFPLILLENGIKIRFTDYRFLNDTSEGEEFPSIFQSQLERLYNSGKINEEFYNEACKLSVDKNPSRLFVACFSENRDSLPMWNYYLKNGKYEGYSLGFDFSNINQMNNISVLKVIYDDKTKNDIIESMIMKAAENKELSVSQQCKELIESAFQLSLLMKKQCFCHEKEIRLVLNYSENENNSKYKCEKIHYCNKNGILQPYCDVTFRDITIFKSCCYAPTMQQPLTELGLDTFFRLYGYDTSSISISKSEIPVRY